MSRDGTPDSGGGAVPELSSPAYLARQYGDSSNLDARIQLHDRFSTNRYGWFRWLFDHIDLPPGACVLELGCGTGLLWRENLDRIPPNWSILLSDASPGMLEEAGRTLDGAPRPFDFSVVDAQRIPFDDDSFDGVIANFMLYHVTDRRRALAEVRRVLRPGGRFYAATVGERHMRELDGLLDRFAAEAAPGDQEEEVGFTLENGRQQLEAYFPRVTLRRYPDELVVTEAEPMIRYVLSTSAGSSLSAAHREELVRHVQAELDRGGAIHITKDSGLFEAE